MPYSPYIKKKITLAEWQNVNRDINEGKLPHKYQEEIYNRIAATPLKLTENGDEKPNLASAFPGHLVFFSSTGLN